MKKTALISMILLAIGVMATTACDPTSLSLDGTRQVKFTATSHDSPMTKTEYGAYTQNGKYQTIKWVAGDKVRIWSPAGESISGTPVPADPSYVYADYTLKNVDHDESNHLSKASLDNVDPHGLVWSGSDGATFYAAYPGDKVQMGSNANGLVFAFPLSAAQSGTAIGVKDMPMLSKQTVRNGQPVALDFYPAFNAIEFEMMSDPRYNPDNVSFTVDWVELSKESASFDPLTAKLFYYDFNTSPASVMSVDVPGYSIKLENLNATVDNDHPAKFIFYTLPYDHTGLVLKVHSKKTADGVTEQSTRTLKLQQNGEWVKFPVGHKAVIKGMPYNPDGLWCFSTITLTGQVVEWTNVPESSASGDNPEATQFAVTGVQNVYQIHNNAAAYEKLRQTWILPTVESTATVSFKIMSPRSTDTKTAKYKVTPQGDTDYYTITPITPLEGNIPATGGALKVSFTVKPISDAIGTSRKVWFTTTVKDIDGNEYNIDSETQLYDMRGYHYFMTQEP